MAHRIRSSSTRPDEYNVTNERRALPNYIHLPAINDAILKQAPFASDQSDQRFWWTQIASEEFQNLLADAFWFTLAHVVQRKHPERYEGGVMTLQTSTHFNRISRSYVGIMKRVPLQKLPAFKRHYEEVLAFALVLCFQATFPAQVEAFRSWDFICRVLDLCTEWIRGFRPAKTKRAQRRGTWIRKCFIDKQKGDLAKLLVSPGKKAVRTRPHYVPLVTRRVKYKFQHSPLIHRYLALNHDRPIPRLASKMTWTEDPGAALRTMALNPTDYRKLLSRRMPAARSVPNIAHEVKVINDVREQIFSSMAAEQLQYRKDVLSIRNGNFQHNTLRPITSEMKALVAAGDIHELSNYIMKNGRPGTTGGVRTSPIRSRNAL